MFLLPYALVLLLYCGAKIWMIRRRRAPGNNKRLHWIVGIDNHPNIEIFEATRPQLLDYDDCSSSFSSCSSSPLARARSMQAPEVTSTTGGEMEHLEFWNAHSQLIQDAWHEWERDFSSIHHHNDDDDDRDHIIEIEKQAGSVGRLPSLNETSMMQPLLKESIQQLWKKPSAEAELDLKAQFWQEPIRSVYTCSSFFTPQGIRNLRTHLKLMGQAGIPTRRPNGMNRNGFVLDDETEGGVSYEAVDDFRGWLVDDYLRPLGRMFFPEFIGGDEDDESSYAFTIHYQYVDNDEELTDIIGTAEGVTTNAAGATNVTTTTRKKRDVQLKEHSDASVFTININLNLPEEEEDYDGSQLLFLDDDDNDSSSPSLDDSSSSQKEDNEHPKRHALEFQPGMAVMHRGLHRHQALPIQKGERHQLVIWLFGTDGYVRISPYEPKEQLSVKQRWSRSKATSSRSSPTWQQTQTDRDPFEL